MLLSEIEFIIDRQNYGWQVFYQNIITFFLIIIQILILCF
jgi:hypothetical protein